MLVSQEFVRNPEFTNYDIAVWCYAFIETYAPYKDHALLSTTIIADQMFGNIGTKRYNCEEISKSLKHLVDSEMLHAEQVGKQYYRVYKDSFDIPDDNHYFRVEIPEIRSIFERNRPFSILRHYLLVLSTINPKTKCGFCSNEKMASFLGEDIETITRYNNILHDMRLIYVYRGVYSSNTYGRYEDKDSVIAEGNKRSGNRQVKLGANHKRRMTQLYNQVKAGNSKYTQDEVMMDEIYDYCSRFPDQYDMSVFN